MSYYYLLRLSSFYFPDHYKCYLFSLVTPVHSVHVWIALFCWFEQIKWWWWWWILKASYQGVQFNGRPRSRLMKIIQKQSVRRSELSVGFRNSEECQMTGLLLVVCSMMLARRLQTHDHQSWSSNVEPGDRRVLPSGVENEQRVLLGTYLLADDNVVMWLRDVLLFPRLLVKVVK